MILMPPILPESPLSLQPTFFQLLSQDLVTFQISHFPSLTPLHPPRLLYLTNCNLLQRSRLIPGLHQGLYKIRHPYRWIESCQNRASTHKYQMTISPAQIKIPGVLPLHLSRCNISHLPIYEEVKILRKILQDMTPNAWISFFSLLEGRIHVSPIIQK